MIARRCPSARVIDLGHGVARHDVRAGALALRAALPYAPAGVHLAVVDPGVGTERRAVAARVAREERILVGPDNGLLAVAAEDLGGVVEAVDVSDSPECLAPVSATFHGRDVFAPVAAALAAGAALADVGEPLEPATLAGLSRPRARRDGDTLVAHVLTTDVYGNVALDASIEDLAAIGVHAGGALAVTGPHAAAGALLSRTFGDAPAGGLLAYRDARGSLALAVNGGSAAALLELARDDELRLRAG